LDWWVHQGYVEEMTSYLIICHGTNQNRVFGIRNFYSALVSRCGRPCLRGTATEGMYHQKPKERRASELLQKDDRIGELWSTRGKNRNETYTWQLCIYLVKQRRMVDGIVVHHGYSSSVDAEVSTSVELSNTKWGETRCKRATYFNYYYTYLWTIPWTIRHSQF